VLFDGERELMQWITDALLSVPPGVPPWAAMRRAAGAIVAPIEANKANGDRLAAIVAATPALRERAASKQAHTVDLITDLLITRGASKDEAGLIAMTTWGILVHAVRAWRQDPRTSLGTRLNRAFVLIGSIVGTEDSPPTDE
jgi:hypothetical protein